MKVLYLGNFSPNKNFAAFNRASGVLKIFKELNYECHMTVHDFNHADEEKYIHFCFHNYKFSKTKFYRSSKRPIEIINSIPDLSVVILYNYPSSPLKRIMKYCRNHNIKVISDVTEWYNTSSMNLLAKILKSVDVKRRMTKLTKQSDGIIVVSDYAKSYYSKYNVIKIRPIFEDKRSERILTKNDKYIFGYAGDTGRKKDDIISFVNKLKENNINNSKLLLFGQIDKNTLIFLEKNHIDFEFKGMCSHEQVVEELRHCDCQIIYRENNRSNNFGFPSKFAESICLGIPVITSNFGDVASFSKDPNVYIFDKTDTSLLRFLDTVRTNKFDADIINQFVVKSYISEMKIFLDKVMKEGN